MQTDSRGQSTGEDDTFGEMEQSPVSSNLRFGLEDLIWHAGGCLTDTMFSKFLPI